MRKNLKQNAFSGTWLQAMDNKKENAFLYLMKETDLHKSLLPWWLTRRSLTVQVSSALQISTYILDINKSSIFLVRGRIGLLLHLHVLFAPMAHTRTHTHTLTPAAKSLPWGHGIPLHPANTKYTKYTICYGPQLCTSARGVHLLYTSKGLNLLCLYTYTYVTYIYLNSIFIILHYHPMIWPSIKQQNWPAKHKEAARDSLKRVETHPSASMPSTALGGAVKYCHFNNFNIE